jgi:hypothetical protein
VVYYGLSAPEFGAWMKVVRLYVPGKCIPTTLRGFVSARTIETLVNREVRAEAWSGVGRHGWRRCLWLGGKFECAMVG